jgi:molybdopterin converting factor small subunit
MRLDIRLYGPFSLASGRSSFSTDLPSEEISVRDLFPLLAARVPSIGKFLTAMECEEALKYLLIVVNDEICTDAGKILRHGDRIKVLTPVMGG